MADERYSVEIKALGKRVKTIRLSRGMTQLDLSLALSKDRSEVSKIENGKLNIEFLTLVKLAVVLDVSLYDLFSEG